MIQKWWIFPKKIDKLNQNVWSQDMENRRKENVLLRKDWEETQRNLTRSVYFFPPWGGNVGEHVPPTFRDSKKKSPQNEKHCVLVAPGLNEPYEGKIPPTFGDSEKIPSKKFPPSWELKKNTGHELFCSRHEKSARATRQKSDLPRAVGSLSEQYSDTVLFFETCIMEPKTLKLNAAF